MSRFSPKVPEPKKDLGAIAPASKQTGGFNRTGTAITANQGKGATNFQGVPASSDPADKEKAQKKAIKDGGEGEEQQEQQSSE